MKILINLLLSISCTFVLSAQTENKIILGGQTLEAFEGYLLDENDKPLSKQISIKVNPQLSSIESPKASGKFLFGVNQVDEVYKATYEVADYELVNTYIDPKKRQVFIKMKPSLVNQLQNDLNEINDLLTQIKQGELTSFSLEKFKTQIQNIDNQLIRESNISIEKLQKLEAQIQILEKSQAENSQNKLSLIALKNDLKTTQLGLNLKKLLLVGQETLTRTQQKQNQTNSLIYTILGGIIASLIFAVFQSRRIIQVNLLKINDLKK